LANNLSITKIQGKKLIKTSIFLFIPWIIFFIFFFSYNTYYFGEALTYYGEQEEFQLDTNKNLIGSFFVFDSDRFDWIKYYSIGLIPDEIKANLMDLTSTNDFKFADNNWVSIILFVILLSALLISWYDKNKRTEVIVLVTFVMGTLLLFSSSYLTESYELNYLFSPDIQERYMISSLVLTLMLFGFLMNRIWKINLDKFSGRIKLRYKSIKFIFLIILVLFLVASFYSSPSVRDIEVNGLSFNNPIEAANMLSMWTMDSEGISGKNVVIDVGRNAVFYNTIPFSTNYGVKDGVWDSDLIDKVHIKILKEIMEESYEVYSFKDKREEEALFFRYLELEHSLILKDYSRTFCKLEQVNTVDGTINLQSDDICYTSGGFVYKKFLEKPPRISLG